MLDQNETGLWSINIMWCLQKGMAGPVLTSCVFLGLPSPEGHEIHSYTNCYSYYWQHRWFTYLRWKFTALLNTLWKIVLCRGALRKFTAGEWEAARETHFLVWKFTDFGRMINSRNLRWNEHLSSMQEIQMRTAWRKEIPWTGYT